MKFNLISPEVQSVPSGSRTMRMIWNETPRGCVVDDKGFCAVCALLEEIAKCSFARFVKVAGLGDLWGCTPREVTAIVLNWEKDWLSDAENTREWFEREALYWETCGVLPPPFPV